METATVTREGESQIVRLPKGYYISTPTVGVRHEGEAIVLEPLRPNTWPVGFFDSIQTASPQSTEENHKAIVDDHECHQSCHFNG